VSLITFTT